MNINASYIHLENILFFAHHGVATQETIVGNEFYINLRLKVDFAHAITTDAVEDTVSYADVYTLLKEEMGIPSKLLEHVCGRIAERLFRDFPAIEEVESFFGNAPKVYDDFYSNLCLRRAVERNIEIIGEAMNRILKIDKDIAITNSRKIVDARNYIIHGYDSLSVDILWSMVINHLPKLKNEVTALLNI